jgi:hypothetical protein
MPQLVFVHGVATRDTPEYRSAVVERDKLFRGLLFKDDAVPIYSPMWGKFVPAIPSEVFDTNKGVATFSLNLGASSGLGAGMMGDAQPGNDSDFSIVAIGKQDPVAALDAICSRIADRAAGEGRPLRDEELRAFRNAAELIASDKTATLFQGDADSQSIAKQLAAGAPSAFGIGNMVADAITKVSDRVRNAASTLGFDAIRGSIGPAVGRFMGDVFAYLKEGELRKEIRGVIGQALLEAQQAKNAGGGPLVLVGHSLGGVILVDMLSDPRSAGLGDGIDVDALLTVGSQPGLFGALDVLAPNAPQAMPRRKPDCVKFWLNVFDAIDPLAYRVEKIFNGAEDLVFNTLAGITETHSKYFQRPQFYARARVRLNEAGIL